MLWAKLSLRYKIMAALAALPLGGLSLFLLVAVSVFKKDKIAYVYDSSRAASQTRAARVGSEVQGFVALAQSVIAGYRSDVRALDEAGQEVFKSQDKLLAFQIYGFDSAALSYVRAVDLKKESASGLPADPAAAQDLILKAKTKGAFVARDPESATSLILAARFGKADDAKHSIAIAQFDASDLAEAFGSSGDFVSFLVQGEKGEMVFGDSIGGGEGAEAWTSEKIWESLPGVQKAPEGAAEIVAPGSKAYLASFVKVGASDLAVVSLVDKNSALRALDDLYRKSLLFFVMTLSFTVFVSVIAARGLTSALSSLLRATQRIAGGDFETRVQEKGKDEIGRLASSFNIMAEEVSRLMKETAEKARMESELATARTVQETLFPPKNASLGPVLVSGHYEPASECGGDWWHYCVNGDFVYLWIGDATGHGAPAALLTSAARAVASVIEMGNPRSPAECLSILNRAIWDASKGKMMMTFFLAAIDKRTGTMYYSNASHEAPLLLHRSSEMPSRDDYVPLNEVNNPRLGENENYEFQETSIELKPGDRIVFYTDGVVDVKSPEAKAWGERKFHKALSSSLHGEDATDRAVKGVVEELQGFRKERPLDDDVTLVLAEYRGAA